MFQINHQSPFGKQKLFTIGPVEMYPDTLKIASRQTPYFRTESFSALMLETDALLKQMLHTDKSAETIYLTASGTAAMEASVLNIFNKSDKLLVVSGGIFGKRRLFQHGCCRGERRQLSGFVPRMAQRDGTGQIHDLYEPGFDIRLCI